MLDGYIPLLMLFGVVLTNAVLMLGLSHLVTSTQPTPVKGDPYESGMPALGSTKERFSVKFYLVAMLFIIFDIETVFMIPWAARFTELGLLGLVEMAIFVVILGVGLAYVWKRGALEWD
ncbi:MAG: NADH-quinone oxidoreductase subunit A [Gemmatimonadales bacterium]